MVRGWNGWFIYIFLAVGMIAVTIGSAVYLDMDFGVAKSTAQKVAEKTVKKHPKRRRR